MGLASRSIVCWRLFWC